MKTASKPVPRRAPTSPARRQILTTLAVSPALLAVIAELAGWKLEGTS